MLRLLLTDRSTKWTYFKILLDIGFEEIDVSFPSASNTELEFTWQLIIAPSAVPENVWFKFSRYADKISSGAPLTASLVQKRNYQSLYSLKR